MHIKYVLYYVVADDYSELMKLVRLLQRGNINSQLCLIKTKIKRIKRNEKSGERMGNIKRAKQSGGKGCQRDF